MIKQKLFSKLYQIPIYYDTLNDKIYDAQMILPIPYQLLYNMTLSPDNTDDTAKAILYALPNTNMMILSTIRLTI